MRDVYKRQVIYRPDGLRAIVLCQYDDVMEELVTVKPSVQIQREAVIDVYKRQVNPPVIRDNKATIDITHIGGRLQWRGGTVKPSGRKSEVTGRRIKSLLIPFKDCLLYTSRCV